MKVVISGASGLIGTGLSQLLEERGCEVWSLTRQREKGGGAGIIPWSPAERKLDAHVLEGCDAIVNLAGENIGKGRWTRKRKQLFLESRLGATSLLVEAVRGLERRPKVFLNASAVGYYGDRGGEELTEESPPGKGFLAELCRQWEASTEPLTGLGVRRVIARIGVVFSPDGGALREMLPAFRVGAGGPIGSGRQYVPWISIMDVARAMGFLIENQALQGVFNLVAPEAATSRDLAKSLGRALHRPALLPLPAFAAKAVFGREKAGELLLVSGRVVPKRLLEAGFEFRHPGLERALGELLGK